jgi:hypothetical protein
MIGDSEKVGDMDSKNWLTKRYSHGEGAPVVPEGRQLDNGRYRMGQRYIGRTGAEGEGTAVGKAVSRRKEASKHNEASTSGSIVRSEILLTQYKMAKAD